MPTTIPWLIAYPDSNSNLTPLESHFQNLATTTNSGLTAVQNAIIASEIDPINERLQLNLTTSVGSPTYSPAEGSMHWDSNLNILYIYSRGTWKVLWHDSDWLNVTISSGFAAMSGQTPQYKIIGGVVYLRGAFAPTGITAANTSYNIGTIPLGFRPSRDFFYTGITAATAANPTKIMISTDGVISIVVSVAGNSCYINGSYAI